MTITWRDEFFQDRFRGSCERDAFRSRFLTSEGCRTSGFISANDLPRVGAIGTGSRWSQNATGILFEGTEGWIFVNRGKLTGAPVEELKSNPLPGGAMEEVYKNRSLVDHFRNFFEAVRDRKEPISDVFSHHRALSTCHLAGIAARLNRKITWDPKNESIVGDEPAQGLIARDYRKGFEIANG